MISNDNMRNIQQRQREHQEQRQPQQQQHQVSGITDKLGNGKKENLISEGSCATSETLASLNSNIVNLNEGKCRYILFTCFVYILSIRSMISSEIYSLREPAEIYRCYVSCLCHLLRSLANILFYLQLIFISTVIMFIIELN